MWWKQHIFLIFNCILICITYIIYIIYITYTENKEEHPKPKKHPGGLHLRRSYSNQHRSVKGTKFHARNNAHTFKLQRTITNALRYKSDPSGNVVNLSKHSFSFDTYKLLNKNLNFIPTSERYKNQLSSDLQNFFRLIKLRAHFKDETCIATVNQPNEQVPFKIKNKEKWTQKKRTIQ